MQGGLLKKSPMHPLKTFTTWVIVTLIRKHKQSASFFCAVRVKVFLLRACGATIIWVPARSVTSAEVFARPACRDRPLGYRSERVMEGTRFIRGDFWKSPP